MGFLAGSMSLTRFRLVEDTVEPTVLAEAAERLRRYAFRDIDNTAEERSFGWVAFGNMLDTSFENEPVDLGDYLVFALRLDTRRVPAAVFKKHVTVAMGQALAAAKAEGKKFLSKDEKLEIRERVALALRARFLPIPAIFQVVWNVRRHHVYLASVHPKVIDLFHEMFTQTFGLHLEPMDPYFSARALLDVAELSLLDDHAPTIFIPGVV
ncbi:MAG: hypothetical protein PWP17_132 [Desulfomicrobiaceae bacterium]|jgi:hypothetical protein|nr:hypothetical protein [Desulfomicrobiaceae bacterium]